MYHSTNWLNPGVSLFVKLVFSGVRLLNRIYYINIQIQNKFIRKPVSFINFMTTYHTFICTMYRSVTPFSINLCSLKKNPRFADTDI